MKDPTPPPRYANAFLRMCCPRTRAEDIEGDLYELFLRRVESVGPARARNEYRLAVFDICVRQLASRMVHVATRPVRLGKRLRLYPLRVAVCIAAIAALLAPFNQTWFVFVRNALLLAFAFPELLLLARAFRRKRRGRIGDS